MKQFSMDKLQALAKTNSQKAREATLRRKQEALQPELDRQLHTALGLTYPDYGEVIKALDAGANPNSRVDGWSPMDTAIYQRDHGAERNRPAYKRIISLLVIRGAKPEKSMEELARELLKAIDEVDDGGVNAVLRVPRMNPDTVVDGWTALGRVKYLIDMEESRSLGERRPVRQDALLDIRDVLEMDYHAKEDLRGEPGGIELPQIKPENRLKMQPQAPYGGKEKDTDLHLHAAVYSLDLQWTLKLLGQGADKDSTVGGLTLADRLRQRKKDLEDKKARISEWAYEREKVDIAGIALRLGLSGAAL